MIVVGAGRVGTALRLRSEAAGEACALVSREEGWEALDGPPGTPIVLAVRNDDLGEVVPRVPRHRREDLVFVQNGMIRPWLRDQGLSGCTRGLLYFAVSTRGERGDPGSPSPFCGPHDGALVRWFVTIGLPAERLDWARFSVAELEKLLWIASFGLLCEVHGEDVGTVCTTRRAELEPLVAELATVGRATMGVAAPIATWVERLCAYSMAIPTYRGSVKEWPWRNGWFVAEARRRRIATPVHDALLAAVGRPTSAD